MGRSRTSSGSTSCAYLRRHHGNSTVAARQLGISRTTLWRKLRTYGIPRSAAE
jgi:transcriptional regulator of acetoin/glycerol metabolism